GLMPSRRIQKWKEGRGLPDRALTMFESLRIGRDDAVLDDGLPAVHAFDRLGHQGDRGIHRDLRTVALHARLKGIVRSLSDREGRPFERGPARVHLNQLHAEVVDARQEDRCAEWTDGVHRELMQVFRQVPREGAHVDWLVVADPMTLASVLDLT